MLCIDRSIMWIPLDHENQNVLERVLECKKHNEINEIKKNKNRVNIKQCTCLEVLNIFLKINTHRLETGA